MRTPNDQPRIYDWERVVQVAGDLMKRLDLYPPRYEVSAFLTDDQFQAMGAPRSL